MEREKLISIQIKPCPVCSGRRFYYRLPEERKLYKSKAVVGKYECVGCGWQSGSDGEV